MTAVLSTSSASSGAMLLDLDTLRQREAWDALEPAPGTGERDAASALAGALRLGFLYGARLVLTDTQVFDGVLLLALGPRGLAELLGSVHRTDVVVTMRAPTPEASLAGMLAAPEFVSATDELGWSAEEVDRRRQEWVRAIARDRVGSTVWPPFADGKGFGTHLRTRLARGVPAHPIAQELLATAKRSEVTRRLETSDLDAETRREIFLWWDAAYMDVLSEQHGTTWLAVLSPQETFAGGSAIPGAAQNIPPIIVTRLARISGAEFATLRADSASVLQRLHATDRGLDRLRLAVAVLATGARPRPVWETVVVLARLATFGLIVISAALDIGLFGDTSRVAVAVTIVLIAAQFPLAAVAAFFRLFSPTARAIYRTPARSR